MRLGFALVEKPGFPVLKPLGLEFAPSRTPLPRGIARALAKPGVRLSLIVGPVPNKRFILSAIFENDASQGHVNSSIRTRKDIKP